MGLSTLSTFENTTSTEEPMSGKAAPHAQATNPAINAYSRSSCPRVSWQILNFQIAFVRTCIMSCSFSWLAQFWQRSEERRGGREWISVVFSSDLVLQKLLSTRVLADSQFPDRFR